MDEVRPGDVVILKRGMSQIVAVGEIVERDGHCRGWNDKPWLRDFDGWNLAAWCNVEWRIPSSPVDTEGLTRATIQRIGKAHLIDLARQMLADLPKRTDYEPETGCRPNPVTDDDLIGHLIQFGLRPGAAEDLTQALRRIRPPRAVSI